MPELPEVQTVVDSLQTAGIAGRRIVSARVTWLRTVDGEDNGARFVSDISGRTIESIQRRGKLIVLKLDPPWSLLVHLRMSGMLTLARSSDDDILYTRVEMALDDGRYLRFRDPRKFGRCTLTRTPHRFLDRLGIEPLSRRFTVATVTGLLGSRRRQLKPLLLDQSIIAGLGNIYVDEVLWLARLHPERIGNTLSETETARLVDATRTILRGAIKNRGTSLGTGKTNLAYPGTDLVPRHQHFLMVFQRAGLPCRRCGTPIVRIVVTHRGTHICPKCQSACST